jgi:hypothetical protein
LIPSVDISLVAELASAAAGELRPAQNIIFQHQACKDDVLGYHEHLNEKAVASNQFSDLVQSLESFQVLQYQGFASYCKTLT